MTRIGPVRCTVRSTPMKRNKALLKKTLRYIERHQKSWNQLELRCGTASCFAGWAALLAGGEWAYPDHHRNSILKAQGKWPRENAWNRAERVLGIDFSEATALFSSDNRMVDLRSIVKGLCE